MLLFGVVIVSLGSVLPQVVMDLGLNEMGAGSLASILPAGILAGSLLFGPVADRYSYKYLLVFSSILVMAGLELIAMAEGLFTLQVAYLMIGLGGGALNGATNALVADLSAARPGAGSANLSLLGVFFGIGALGVPALMAILYRYWDYRQILQMAGLTLLVPMGYFLFISFPHAKLDAPFSGGMIRKLVGDRTLLMFGLFLFFESALEGVITNWSTTFFQADGNLDATSALSALSTYMLGLTLTRLVLAGTLRRFSPFTTLMVSLVIILAGVMLMSLLSSPVGLFAGMVLLGTGTAAGFPVILGYVGELYHQLRGTAFSIVMVMALTGNILFNYLVGLLARFLGIGIFPWVLLFCTTALLLIALVGLRGKSVDQ